MGNKNGYTPSSTRSLIASGLIYNNPSTNKWGMKCPACKSFDKWFIERWVCVRELKKQSKCISCTNNDKKIWMIGRKHAAGKRTIQHKKNISLGKRSHPKTYSKEECKKISSILKEMWQDPIKRAKMLDRCKWECKAVDKGCRELLEKWNRLGFNFKLNHQVKTKEFMAYLDGYDQDKNVAFEYDTKYHFKEPQRSKDIIRQQKIIEVLKPVRFWRYNAVDKIFTDVVSKQN